VAQNPNMAGTIVLLVPADVNNITVDETAAMEAWGLKTITLQGKTSVNGIPHPSALGAAIALDSHMSRGSGNCEI